MKHSAYMSLAFLMAGAFLVGCDVAPPKPSGSTAAVSVIDYSFSPSPKSIAIGTTVVWTNAGSEVHHVSRIGSESFDSANLPPSQSFSHTFTTAGTFDYECGIHPGMDGTITVTN